MEDSPRLQIVAEFVREIFHQTQAKEPLLIKISSFSVFDLVKDLFTQLDAWEWSKKIPESKKYDLIFGDFPLAWKTGEFRVKGQQFKCRRNWVQVFNTLKFLQDDGYAVFVLEPELLFSNEGIKFENVLNQEGYFIHGVFNAPQDLLVPFTSLTPIFTVIRRKSADHLFVAELLGQSQSRDAVRNYFSLKEGSNLIEGLFISRKEFLSFHQFKIQKQIEKLQTQYKKYSKSTLGEIANEINSVRQGGIFSEKDNSIYIPRIGNSPVVYKIEDAQIKHQNYFQVVLSDKAINEYMAAFFRSALGELILSSITTEGTIPHRNKRELAKAQIALPPYDVQKQIVSTQRKLQALREAIDTFDLEVALNPTSSLSMIQQLDKMLDAINGLTEADKVRRLIREGESKTVEFKQTLSLDVNKKIKATYIEVAILKTIVGFLNTYGGVLLVGVNDEGTIVGIDAEIHQLYKNVDKFLLHVKNMIKEKIGEEFYPYIEYKPIQVDEQKVLLVECGSSQSPCYLEHKEFYVRTNPSTDKLEGPKLVEYIRNHFHQ